MCQVATGFKIVRGINLEDFRQVQRAFVESGFSDLPNSNRLMNKLVDHAEFLNTSGIF